MASTVYAIGKLDDLPAEVKAAWKFGIDGGYIPDDVVMVVLKEDTPQRGYVCVPGAGKGKPIAVTETTNPFHWMPLDGLARFDLTPECLTDINEMLVKQTTEKEKSE